MEPLKQQRVKAKAKLMFKTLNNMGPNSLKELFTFKMEILNHNLRGNSSSIRLPKPNANNSEEKFYVRWSFYLELHTTICKRK
jgi:hypothetical protein